MPFEQRDRRGDFMESQLARQPKDASARRERRGAMKISMLLVELADQCGTVGVGDQQFGRIDHVGLDDPGLVRRAQFSKCIDCAEATGSSDDIAGST